MSYNDWKVTWQILLQCCNFCLAQVYVSVTAEFTQKLPVLYASHFKIIQKRHVLCSFLFLVEGFSRGLLVETCLGAALSGCVLSPACWAEHLRDSLLQNVSSKNKAAIPTRPSALVTHLIKSCVLLSVLNSSWDFQTFSAVHNFWR